MNRQHGFTLIELTAVMAVLVVLAGVAFSRISADQPVFAARGFYDQVISSLRYAQQAALSQNRYVCAAFSASGISYSFGASAACGSPLSDPDGAASYIVFAPSMAANQAVFSTTPTSFSFAPDGTPNFGASNMQIDIAGLSMPICIAAGSGFVYQLPSGQTAC